MSTKNPSFIYLPIVEEIIKDSTLTMAIDLNIKHFFIQYFSFIDIFGMIRRSCQNKVTVEYFKFLWTARRKTYGWTIILNL